MKDKILNTLQFGFELEGLFKLGLRTEIDGGEFVHDGSVATHSFLEIPFTAVEIVPTLNTCRACNVEDGTTIEYCVAHHARYRREGQASTEFASGIYKKFDKLKTDLKKFNSDNFIWNNSCGFHFHIGMKDNNYKLLWRNLSDWDFLRTLLRISETLCEHQNARLKNKSWAQRYYHFWETPSSLINDTQTMEKYRFIHFHRQLKTVELRFLVPCEHKVENIERIMDIVTEHLACSKETKTSGSIETSVTPIVINIETKLKSKNERLDIHKKLFVHDSLFESKWSFPMTIPDVNFVYSEEPYAPEPEQFSGSILEPSPLSEAQAALNRVRRDAILDNQLANGYDLN